MKMGVGDVILFKLILVPQKIPNKTSTFWLDAPQKISKCIPELQWQNWHKILFLLHFHVCTSSNNSFEWIHFFMWCIYILSFKLGKNWSSWSKAILTLFRMGGGGKKAPPTSFSPVTSTNVGFGPQNFLTFSFNPFATL